MELTFDVLHRNKGDVFSLSDFVNCRDVRMVQGGCGPRLVLKPAQTFRIFAKRGRKEFKGDLTTEARVLSEINLAHTARAQAQYERIGA